MQGTVTLAETYASSLEQTQARIFWTAAAINNSIVIGSDASNAYAKAPPPIAPLYICIDNQYQEWYKTRYSNKPPIPKGAVMKVQCALQGHPESARLWSKLIDKIIKTLGLTPCTHESNLYYCSNYNKLNTSILLLRQVDDFAIACDNKEIAHQVTKQINSKLTCKIKELGITQQFNGVDITQTCNYIKLTAKTYISKIEKNHKWLSNFNNLSLPPTPMSDDPAYLQTLEQAKPLSPHQQQHLKNTLGFTYKQAIGELIYALVICRPDISFACSISSYLNILLLLPNVITLQSNIS